MRRAMIEFLSRLLKRGWQTLGVRLNLQWKILLLVAVSMSLILFTSSYLHTTRTRAVIGKDHYENAISQTLVLTNRISLYDYFSSLEDLQQEMQLVAGSRPDFKQIDVYQNSSDGPRLLATTSPGAPELSSLSPAGNSKTTQSRAGISSSEITRNNSDYWLIRADITSPQQSGFIEALVLKSAHHQLVDSLHREYNLVLFGALLASVGLLYLLFSYFFRRPVKEILQALAETRGGSLARAPVIRDDELGAIAQGFNQLMDVIADRSREREDLLHQISELNNELLKKVEIATNKLRSANADLIRTQQRLA